MAYTSSGKYVHASVVAAKPLRASAIRLPSLVPTATTVDMISQTLNALMCGQARVAATRDEIVKFCVAALYTYREVVGAMHPRQGIVHALNVAMHVLSGSPADAIPGFHSQSPGCSLRGALVPLPFEDVVHETFARRVNRWLCTYFALAWARFQRCRAAVVAWIRTSETSLSKSDMDNLLHKMDHQQFVVQMCALARRGIYSRVRECELVSRIPWLVVFGPTHSQIIRLCNEAVRRTKMVLPAALNTMDKLHCQGILSVDPRLSWPVVFDVQQTFMTPAVLDRCVRESVHLCRTLFPGDLFREIPAGMHVAMNGMRRGVAVPPPAFVALYWQDETRTRRIRATYTPRVWEGTTWRITAIYGPYHTLEAAERAVLAYNAVNDDNRSDAVFMEGDEAAHVRVWR